MACVKAEKEQMYNEAPELGSNNKDEKKSGVCMLCQGYACVEE